ncbi:hypothetical protein [Fibrella aquatilis]|uniref:Uncharacterized protein n=1 Tax=Fibrella aquatilis TaxID=2817059 RepID=A0A939G568_9BACT|nr:hypothetical protein [Fibrella aquatilis]MBO0932329.1 hypothetical protein [Fibrella aquatilis]
MAHPPVALHTPYERPKGLTEWAHWRTIANTTLTTLNAQTGRTSDVRIWPHHFDTGVYYAVTDADGAETSAIWAGYSIADTVCNEPYFYLSGYRRDEPINFAVAPALTVGEWRNATNWQGAMLPVSHVSDTNVNVIDTFYLESNRWLRQVGA